jgi:hypothetical protein
MHNKSSLDNLETWIENWIHRLNSRYIDPNGQKCPYAKSVLDNNRLKIVKMLNAAPIDFWSKITVEADNLNDDIDVIVVATEANKELYGHYFVTNGGVDALNCAFNVQNKDVWLLSATNDLYTVVFIQRITDIDDASKSLEQDTNYYNKMTSEYFDRFILQRRILRERLN